MRRLLVTCTKRRQTEVGAPFGTCSSGLVGVCGATEHVINDAVTKYFTAAPIVATDTIIRRCVTLWCEEAGNLGAC